MSDRPETGPLKFGEDWQGLFIRGDNAAYYGLLLGNVLAHMESKKTLAEFPDLLAKQYLQDLLHLLLSCNEFSDKKREPQQLKDFAECLEK